MAPRDGALPLEEPAHASTAERSAVRLPQSPPRPDEFDWATDDSVVISEQPATAIYRNRWDQIVIRQQARDPGDPDPHIVIDEAQLGHFIAMLEIEKAKR